jgi:L-rhamnose mutarotase
VSIQRVASVIRLVPEKEAAYRELHAEVWPGVLDTLRKNGVTNYSIFLRDGVLFSYLEYVGEDYEASMARIGDDPTTKEWWEFTDPCQRPVDSAAPGEWWAPLEEVFHLA